MIYSSSPTVCFIVYRKYVEKLLRNKGMKKTFDKVGEVIRDVMNRTLCILEEPHRIPHSHTPKVNNRPLRNTHMDEYCILTF